MKKYSLIVVMFFLMQNSIWAKFKNGYEKDICVLREKLESYNRLNATNDLSSSDRRKMKSLTKKLILFQSYCKLTEELLNEFKTVSPDLYNRIDSITDAKGRFTDVYVKFIHRRDAQIMAAGVTHMSQAPQDKDACFSEYGKHTVSIKIWLFSNALLVLSHELGHVNYQVRNLETYTKFYKRAYPPFRTESNRIGHSSDDKSGKNAETFEKKFRKDYSVYLKLRKVTTQPETFAATGTKRKVSRSRS